MAVVESASAGLRATDRATILQLRAPRLDARELERETGALVASSHIPVLVSSRCDVALATRAAGVNLPERDIGVAAARALMGELLIGRSVHSIEGAALAEHEGADFVIFGPVWPSASHPQRASTGLNALAAVAAAVRIPVLAIGGVTQERIDQCHRAGAAGYAAIGLFR
jgi:thiamine-phosphate pyrophosphorylase